MFNASINNRQLLYIAGIATFLLVLMMSACQYDIVFSPPWKNKKADLNKKITFLNEDFFNRLGQANQSKKPVFIDFYTDWCAPCKRMDRDVFTDATVVEHFDENFICLKINAERGEGLELAQKFNINTYPTLVFIDSEGVEENRLVGFASAQKLLKNAKKVN